jgi:hypothetical protein
MRRSSAAQYNVMSATQPHAATARRPASSTTSPLLQSQPPAFTGRIVTASGQPRKGAAAAAVRAPPSLVRPLLSRLVIRERGWTHTSGGKAPCLQTTPECDQVVPTI